MTAQNQKPAQLVKSRDGRYWVGAKTEAEAREYVFDLAAHPMGSRIVIEAATESDAWKELNAKRPGAWAELVESDETDDD
jgi:hypothetical protein